MSSCPASVAALSGNNRQYLRAVIFLADAASTSHGAIPYVVALLCVFAAVLYFAFAPDTVISGSFAYMLFGSYFAPLVLAALIGIGLYYSLPSIAASYNVRIANYSYTDSGKYAAIGFAVICFLGFIMKVGKTRRRARKRGGLN